MVKIESERFNPVASQLEFVRDCARSIKSDSPELDDWAQSYIKGHAARIALDLDIIERYAKKGDAITEFGSAPLLLTAALKKRGYTVRGIDLDPDRFAACISSLGLDVIKCDFETESVPLPDDSADVVVFNELFEHMRLNLIQTMREVRRILRPGGTLLLSTPNLRSIVGIVNFIFHNRAFAVSGNPYDEYLKLEEIGHMGHVREYTTREVREFLGKTGFDVEVLIFRGRYPKTLQQFLVRLFPSLRPFVTYVARGT